MEMIYKDQFIFGKHPVWDAIQSGQSIDKVWVQIGLRGDFLPELRTVCKELGIPVQMVPKEKFNKVTRKNHQGVLAFVSLTPYYKLEDVLPQIYEREQMPLVLVLDGVTDVRNLGAIARSAEVFGAHAIVIGRKNIARVNAEAMKAAAGALSVLPVCREASPQAAVEYLKLSGLHIAASDLKASTPIHEVDFTQPTAILIGAEDRGVHHSLTSQADSPFIIPQVGQTDSLNVSVAAGVILYEVCRQRGW